MGRMIYIAIRYMVDDSDVMYAGHDEAEAERMRDLKGAKDGFEIQKWLDGRRIDE